MRLLAKHSPGFDPAVPWDERSSVIRVDSPLFKQITATRRSPHTRREHAFTRLHCPEWINVVAFRPLAEGGELLVVEQFRHGIDAPTLEIVGGICDAGEDPFLSAQRELREETGHEAGQWISLGSCAPNPATQTNRCHFFLALDCRSQGELRLDPCEELQVWAVPWQEWEAKMKSGEISHALVLAAFLRLTFWEGWEKFKADLPQLQG